MSDDPVRLRDDPRVSNALRRDLVRAAQHGVAAPAFDVTAALASFEAARAGASGSSSTASPASHAVRSARWWGIGAVGIATLIAATVLTLRPWHSNAPSQTAPAPVANTVSTAPNGGQTGPTNGPGVVAPATNATAPQSPVNATPTRSSAPRNGSASGLGTREPSEATLRGASSAAPPSASESSDAPSGSRHAASQAHVASNGGGDDLLARDERMLTDTYALLDMDPARALSSADAGIRMFPDSRHLEDREALAVRALGALHRSAEARARGARFLARWPSSQQALMVRQAMMR